MVTGLTLGIAGSSFATVAAAAEVIRKKHGISANGSIAIDTAQSYFGGSSVLSTGSADSLLFDGAIIPTASDANFTIESWVRFTGTNSRKMLYSQYTSGTGRTSLEIGTDEKASFFCARQSSFQEADRILGDSALSVDTWYHIAVVRQGTTFTMYIDGVAQTDTITGHSAGVQNQDFEIFGDDFGTHTDDVHQDEFRISDTARYTGNFSKPIYPFVNDANTLLLCHFDGTDGSTFFDDDNGEFGRHPVSVTAVNGNTQIDTAQSQFGGASALFDGTDDNIDINFRSDILTNTETIEFWYRPTSVSGVYGIMSQNTQGAGTGFQILQINGEITAYQAATAGTTLSGGSLSANTWHHIALVNDGGSAALYIDGTSVDTDGSWSGTNTDTDLRIGEGKGISSSLWNATRYDLNGHIDELRISDSARYTAGFTVSSESFTNDENTRLLMHFDGTDTSTVFRDDFGNRPAVGVIAEDNARTDTAEAKFGVTSAEFPSTFGFMETGAVDALEVSGDWTIEFFVYYNKTNADQYVHHNMGGWSGGSFQIYTPSSSNIRASINDNGTSRDLATVSFSTGQWYHYALVNNSGTVTWYIDGTSQGTGAFSSNINAPDKTLRWGAFSQGGSSDKFEGWIDEYRFSNTARYTTNFTPTTTPFVNDSNTLLLLHMDGTDGNTLFLDDNGMTRAKVGVQSINGAAIDTANYQWNGASAEFDDTDDYLELPFSVGNFSGDFTVECWMDTADTLGEIMACQKQGTNEGWTLITRSLNRLIWTSTTDGSSIGTLISSDNAWSDNTWVHIAVCHNNSSGLTELYANGTRVASQTEQNPITVTSGGYFRIGGNIFCISSGLYQDGPRYFDGHLDDVRISNSVRYSGASYTVPTGPFQNDSNTVLLLPMNGTDGSTDFVDDNGKEIN